MKIYQLCVVVLLVFGKRATCIPLENFYSFGSETSDSRLRANDDGSSGLITLSFNFPYFGSSNRNIFVNNNGIISFNAAVSQFSPEPFPLGDGRMIIAPYWADVDTRGTGTIWYRESTDAALLARARREIRSSFITQLNFQPTMLFIATWDHVGYYSRHTDLTNTFQCVLVTDGSRSFTIFNYADGLIQWTTGDASGGSRGFGGTAAQVGFNAGDGIRFTNVPGSQTQGIVNIDTTTNVCESGVWIFRVDEDEIVMTAECGTCTQGPGASLNVGPRVGNLLGGTAVYISGPCFDETNNIRCYFSDDQEAVGQRGIYVNNFIALCVSPSFETPGWKPLRIGVGDGETMNISASSQFYAMTHEDTDDVRLEHDSLLLTSARESTDAITVTWDPPSLLPTIDASMYTVDIELYRLNNDAEETSEGQYRPFLSILRNVPNNGRAVFPVPAVRGEPTSAIYPVTLRISISGRTDSEEPSIIDSVAGSIAQWTSTLYYYSVSQRLDILCRRWNVLQPNDIGDRILDRLRLAPCPPRVDQARAQNSGFREDSGYWARQTNRFFHPNAETCFRQRTIPARQMGSGQQCCYRDNGELLVGPGSGGSVDSVAPGRSNTRHIFEDLIPAVYCCKGQRASSTCNLYYRRRPSDDGSRYNPPPPACVYGDPHIVTLDGFKYTFNGLGEFVLIETNDNLFTLQGRMVQAINNNDNPISATVFSAIAGKEAYSDTVQFQLTDDSSGVEVLMNGDLVDFEDLTEQMFNNVTVRQDNSTIASAVFASGVYIEVRAANGILSTLLVSLAESYRSQTTGLMGNFDNDVLNDLLPRGSDTPISVASSLQDIHNQFGITWIIDNANDSLFTYGSEEGWDTFYQPTFQPVFEPTFSTPTLARQAAEICDSDPFCLFDIAATNRLDIGLTTLQGNIEFETISNISQPVTCNPPCEFGVCVRTNTCSCSDGYRGDTCAERIVGECEENFCENGGTCSLVATSSVCTCPVDFTGLFCEEPLIGSGDPLACTCTRDIECSFTGQLTDSQITSTTNELKCTIIASESDDITDSIVIDDTFSAEFLSPGSLTFLSSIGALSRDIGFTPCALESDPSRPLLEVLGIEKVNVVYLKPDGSFGAIDLSMQDAIFGGNFTVELDEVNQCSLVNLFSRLSRPQLAVATTCRDPNADDSDTTVAYFPISCTGEF